MTALKPVERGSAAYTVMVARLDDAGLPTGDLNEADSRYFTNADGSAFGGLSLFGSTGLLRSMVVTPKQRGTGVGGALLNGIVAQARQLGIRDVWLLTEKAEPFFARYGFTRADRESAPEPIVATGQFRELCPSTATLMVLRLS